jgi:ribosome biogenesis GTPase
LRYYVIAILAELLTRKKDMENLGFDKEFYTEQENIARVISEHKERYTVQDDKGVYSAEITGNLRFSADSREDFPAVGDWVEISKFEEDFCIITKILDRKTMLARKSIGDYGDKQIIATNIDFAFIMQAVDRDFNINRIERYVSLVRSGGIEPIIVLNKIDLLEDGELQEIIKSLEERQNDIDVLAVSNLNGNGIDELKQIMEPSKTYCLVGSSGVGKSTLINTLMGKELLDTMSLSDATNKGRHTTTRRELIILEDGSIIIDTPGMREVGMADSESGIEITFEEIAELSENCRFADCNHESEPGCAIREAIENGDLDEGLFENYKKLERENRHYNATVAERRKKDKEFGKMVKGVMKIKKIQKRR